MYLPMVSLLLIILVKVGRKIKIVCQDEPTREPPEPSIISADRDESEIALHIQQLQLPLLNVGYQYTL